MSRRQGSIVERSPGHWLVRYSINLAAGRRRLAVTVKGDRKTAEKELRRLLTTADDGTHIDPNRMTTGEWLTRWLAAVREKVAPKSHERYGEIVRHFLIPAFGKLQLTKLASVHIEDYYSTLSTGGRRDGKPGGLSPQTRRHIHRVLSAALVRAVDQRLLVRNPCDVFRRELPKVERHEMTVLNVEQSAQLLDAVRYSHIYWPVLLALATGMRRGEVLAIRWRNIDLERGSLRIVESLEQTRAGLRFKSPKTDRSRAVTLPSFVVEELRRLKREQAESLLMVGVRQTGATLVCARADGEPLQPQSLTHEFPRFLPCLGSDFPRVRFHDLRHSHATQLLSAGVHPKIAQERLGHSTISTTLDLYSHVSDTMQEDAAGKIDAAFRAVPRK